MSGAPQPRGVHLVGSVPLPTAEEVFRTTCEVLGNYVRRLPDGETGERRHFAGYQRTVILENPGLEPVPPAPDDPLPVPKAQPRLDACASEVTFPRPGYAACALQSYQDFVRLRAEGVIPLSRRFLVALPTPMNIMGVFVRPEWQAALEVPYEAQLLEDLRAILDAVPPEDLAIQWDLCVEMWQWEGWIPAPFSNLKQGLVSRVARLSHKIPANVELGYHLCFGDWSHQHLQQPRDSANLVEMTNMLMDAVQRSIQWLHLPVPRDRTDDAYFAPLREMRLRPETELYLGLVHFTDGVAGTRARLAAAQKVVEQFGISTECGLGRRPADRGGTPDTLRELLRIHAEVAAPL
jgi:hypothetical protein